MKSRFNLFSALMATSLPLTFGSLTFAASVTYDANTTTTAAQDGAGAGWNTTNTNFWNGTADVVWPNGTADEAIFGANSGAAGSVTTGTVNANRITFNAPGSGNYTLSGGTITLNGTTPTITATASATISSVLTGSAGLTKAGAGALTLTGGNNYSGGTTLSAGQLNINNATALGAATGALSINGGTLDNTASGAISLTNNNPQNWNSNFTFTGTQNLNLGAGAVAMSASRTVTVNGSTLTVGGAISGSGFSLTKAGAGTLTLSSASTYSGGTTISAGSLSLLNTTAKTSTYNVAAGATLGLGVSGANAFTTADVDSLFANTLANVTMNATSLVGIDTTNGNFSYANSSPGTRGLNKLGTGTLTLTGANIYSGITIRAGTLLVTGSDTLASGSYAGAIANIGTLQYSSSADQTLSGIISGTGALIKDTGAGTLTLSAANTYSGATTFSSGVATFTGTGASSGNGSLALGTTSGSRAVLNMNSSGTITYTSGNVGGAGASAGGAGAINQSSGTVSPTNNTGYFQLGNGGYGSYVLSGGTINITNSSGMRIGDNTGGLGSYVQTGGTVNASRYFVIGGNQGTAPVGVATFTGGTLNGPSGFYFILGNGGTASGTMNVGTAAGGNATIVSNNANGIDMSDSGTPSANLNLNSGTIQFNTGTTLGGIRRNNGTGATVVNLNGGTLKAGVSGLTMISSNLASVNVYNGGLKVDTQTFDSTISANLLTTTGKGLYPATGVINMPSAAGAGYIGAPLVTVTTSGTGAGATAVANMTSGQVTGVTLTCPGQGYLEGDTVTFTFAGGGSTSAASPFVFTLTAADLAANGTGGLTKLGTGKLTLSGANTFTGPVAVTGKLDATNLSLNNTSLTINGYTPNPSAPPVNATSGFTTGGVVPVVINGTFSAGTFPLIWYPSGGSIGGSGFSALQLQTGLLPRGVVASLVDNVAGASVDLNVTEFNPLTWKGNLSGAWDINTSANWTIGPNPEIYQEADIVVFNDSVGAGSTDVVLGTAVAPASVTFDNDTKNYTLSGSGGITGTTGLTKTNNGTVTLLNANTCSGSTTVNGGTLQLGDGTTNGSITGALVNNATVTFNPAGTATYAGAISGDGNGTFVKTGNGTQVYTGTSNTANGIFQINQGTYQIGNGVANGAAGTCAYQIAAGARLRFERATAATPSWGNLKGAGTIALNSAQAVNASADWGSLALSTDFTGTLSVEKGRVNATSGNSTLGNAAMVEILSGAQFLAFSSATSYTTPIKIAGGGWGETGYPGGLRLAASATATWDGSVTLTGDSGIMAQRGTNFTVTGAISGPFTCEFYAGDPQGDSGTLTVAPAAAVQNSYTATRINGRPNGSIVAGNAFAFSTGPLVVDNAILKLNGQNLNFANLSGAGGAIGNYNATTPATLTTGTDGSSTSYAGVLRDGAAAPLALVKTGSGTLTLTVAPTYTGNTTINQGKLVLPNSSFADTSTVTISSGAVLQLTAATSDIVGTLTLGGVNVGPGTYNSSHPTYGSYFLGAGSLVVGGAYDAWASLKGLDGTPGKENALDADPDKDGITNLSEFYLDGNPLANDPAILPVASLNTNYLTLTFKRRNDAEATVTAQMIQYGATLAGWADVAIGATSSTDVNGVIVTVVETNATVDTITAQIPRSLALDGKLFGRLKVTK